MLDRQKIILILDDNVDLLEMVSFQFNAKGYKTYTATNGIEGLEALKNIKPDLIIMDINMPQMGGIEFYQRICDKDNKPQYPVMVLTARADLQQLFKEFHVDGFMIKPVDLKDLFEEVDCIIKKEERQHDKNLGTRDEKRIFVVEDNEDVFKEIDKAFHNSGYVVSLERDPIEAINKIMKNPPHVALLSLALPEISGDLIALRLKMMPKTSLVKSLLYIDRNSAQHAAVMSKIRNKTGVWELIEYMEPQELLNAVDKVFKIR